MKTSKAIVAALLIGASPAVWGQYSTGTNDLAQTNISAALADFTTAVAGPTTDPNYTNANVYLALTRLLALPNQPTASNFLNQIGISAAGRNDYHWTAPLPETTTANNRRELIVPNMDADQFTGELRNDIAPALIASEANLAQVTDPNFTLFLPGNVTHFSDVTIDYGDVQMVRAILDGMTVFGYTLNTWNMDAQLQAVSNIFETDQSIQALLSAFPNLLTTANSGDQSLAGGAFTNGINDYFAASQVIRSRPAGVRRLFNLDTNELNDEQNFRAFLTGLEGSMSAPLGGPGVNAGIIPNAAFYDVISIFTNHTLFLSNFFGGQFNLRSLLPAFAGDAFFWDSFPDTTLGGVLTGLTETNLGKIFIKEHLFQAQLALASGGYTVLSSPSNSLIGGAFNGVVQGRDGNFYGATPFGGLYGDGSLFKVSASGDYTLLYSFGTETDMFGDVLDGGQPSGLVAGNDNNLYGTTQWGGDYNFGTIFMITPAGQFAVLYSFGQQSDDNSIGGIPMVLGNDGNLYGATPVGGGNGAGILFEFVPPSGGNGGSFSDLYSLPPDAGPQGNGASGAGGMIQGIDGYFYGVTQYGGTNGTGSIFQFIPGNGGQFNTLYSFPNVSLYDMFGNPVFIGVNALVQGRDGVLYGTTLFGGNDVSNYNPNAGYLGGGDGTLFSLTTNGVFTQLYLFDQSHFDGFAPYGAMVEGTPGVFYGKTAEGGGNGKGTIFAFTPGSAPSFVVWFNKGLGQFDPGAGGYNPLSDYYYYPSVPMGLTAGTGGIYGTNPEGGANKDGTVFCFNVSSAAAVAISPAWTTNVLGSTVTLDVTATGSAPLSYQWMRVGSALPAGATGANSGSLTFTGLSLADGGSYYVVVTNTYGSATSAVAQLTVAAPPAIVSEPAASVSILQGQALSLQVGASGSGLVYQWSANNVSLSDAGNVFGSATANLVITPAFTANSGSYQVIVSSPFGAVTSTVSAVTVQMGTLGQQYSAGVGYLTLTNLNQALASFSGAVTASPADPDANVYLALTRLLALPNEPAGSNFLNRLGFLPSGRNDYHWTSRPQTNKNGKLIVAANLDADEFTAELRTNVLPALIASEANLAAITDTNFGMFLPGSVTHFADVTIDYGDVQMMRAILDAMSFFGYTLHSWNLDAQFGAVSNIVATDRTFQAVLSANPNLLTVADAGDQRLAGGEFTNAINNYFAASQFIRSRRAGVRLFNMVTNDWQDEQNFRQLLAGLESSMSGPFGGPGANAGAIPGAAFYDIISDLTNHAVSMSNFFDGLFSVRSLLPAITNNAFIWDSFPDTTLGGLISGLTEANLGKAFLKHPLDAQLNVPGVAYTVLTSPTNNDLQGSLNGVVLGADGNLYGTALMGGTNGAGSFFKAGSSGGFTELFSFAMTDAYGDFGNGGNPSSVVLGNDNNFYGTTGYGGTNGYGNGTVFKITPAGKLTTVYTFGDQDDGSLMGGNPLLLGKDGNLYGATQFGGNNGVGVIFEITAAPGGAGTESNFTVLTSLTDAGAGALVQGKDGYFYGTDQSGGNNGSGSFFQIIPANGGQLSTLYSFPVFYDGYGNQIMLSLNTPVQASNGLFYGTAQYGGNNIQTSSGGEGDGFLYSVDTNGNFTPLYSFDENNFDGFSPIGPLVQGTNGVFYGITASGGANRDGTIFQFTPGGVSAPLVWFNKSLGDEQGGQSYYNGMAYFSPLYAGLTEGAGIYYGTTPGGGQNGNGTVFSLMAHGVASILVPPASTNQIAGFSVTLTVQANGPGTLTYRWGVVGGTLPPNAAGSTSPSLTLPSLTLTEAGSYYVVVANSYGGVTSEPAVLTVLSPASIATQPAAAVAIPQGAPLSLTVKAGGTAPFTYQWYYGKAALTNGGNISGSTNSNLIITPAYATNSGSYSVIVSNAYGSATSAVSAVTVGIGPNNLVFSPVNLPTVNVTNLVGYTNIFTVSVGAGTPPFQYQWRKNGTAAANNVPGATSASLKLANLVLTNSGSYYVVVSNAYSSVTSGVAVLTVLQGPTITSTPVAPSGILQGEKLSITVAAKGSGLSYEWLNHNVILRDNGVNISGSATANLVINPAYITNSGPYTVIVSNAIGSATSQVFTVTVSADTVKPGVTIASPATDGTRSNVAPWIFSGTAPDTVPVLITNVYYWITNLNGAPLVGPVAASLTPGLSASAPSNWTASVSPPAGSNIFAVQSRDLSGNPSPFASRKFFAESPVPLALAIAGNGSGTFKGTNFIRGETNTPARGAPLFVGETYSITATADAHSFFTGWGGTYNGAASGQTLTFIMEGNTSLTATFVTNIFLGMAGTYNGLFSNSIGVAEETAGMIYNLALKTNGVFSATVLYLDGSAPGISGTFSPEGYWSNTVPIALEKNVKVELNVNAGSAPRTITGWVIGTNSIVVNGANQAGWTSDVLLVASITNSSQFAGNYTMLIPPPQFPVLGDATKDGGGLLPLAPAAPTNPPGYGYAVLTVKPGTAAVLPYVSFSGALADGTPITPAVPIGESNTLPVYVTPYSSASSGMLFGWLNLSNTLAGPTPSGNLTWIKKAAASGSFEAGFTNSPLAVQGSPWTGLPLNYILPPDSLLTVSGGGLSNALTLGVTASGTDFGPASPVHNFKSGSVNTNNGQMTVNFTNNFKLPVTGRGVWLQDLDFGGGFFVSPAANPTNFGSILLEP